MGKKYQSNPDIPKEIRSDYRKRKEWLKARGLCIHCTYEKAEDGYLGCRMCRERIRDKAQRNKTYKQSEVRENKNLILDADEAIKLGMSYGHYMALKAEQLKQNK